MDVSKVQKINSLALDLMKQGLAKDREDAVMQAERAFESHKEDYSSLRERMDSMSSASQAAKPAAPLSQDQVREILEQNSAFMVKKIKEFQDKLTAVEQELATLRARSSIISSPRPVERAEEKAAAAPAPAAGAANPSHPRYGSYKQEDVSIEKIFSFAPSNRKSS